MTIGAVVLAAGASTRMGAPKQLIQVDGKSLLRRAAEAAVGSGCNPVIVVLGAQSELVGGQLAGIPVLTVHNGQWREGLASSIRAGLRAALEADPNLSALLITLCDQPFVGGAELIRLLDLYRGAAKPIAAASYGTGLGVPAIFGRGLFPELLELDGDEGARRILKAHTDDTAALAMPSAAIDLDTPLDVESYSAKLH